MKKYLYLITVIVITFVFSLLSHAQQGVEVLKKKAEKLAKDVVPTLNPDADYVDGVLYVKYGKDKSDKVKNLHSQMNSSLEKDLKKIRWHRVKLPKGTKVHERILDYLKDPDVEYAEPAYIYELCAAPNDPYYTDGSLWGLDKIQASSAWDISKGSNSIVVAVVDTGVAHEHPDLNANIWTNPGEIPSNGIDDDGNGYIDDVHGWDFSVFKDYVTGQYLSENHGDPSDYYGHGTHVAGTIGAVGNNGAGVVGVNWNVQIMALRIFGTTASFGGDAEAIVYAADNGAKVINASYRGSSYSQAQYDAINYANSKGVLFVAAAGNDSSDNDSSPKYPATYNLPNIISVAATDSGDQLAGFSNYGASTVHVAAPGASVWSTYAGRKIVFLDNLENGASNWYRDGTWSLWTLYDVSGDTWFLSSPSLCYYDGEIYIQTVSALPIGAERGVKLQFYAEWLLSTNDYLSIWYYDGLNYIPVSWYASSGYGYSSIDLSAFDSEHRELDGHPVFSLDTVNNTCDLGISGYAALDDVAITAYAPATSDDIVPVHGTSMAAPHVTGLAALMTSPQLLYHT